MEHGILKWFSDVCGKGSEGSQCVESSEHWFMVLVGWYGGGWRIVGIRDLLMNGREGECGGACG